MTVIGNLYCRSWDVRQGYLYPPSRLKSQTNSRKVRLCHILCTLLFRFVFFGGDFPVANLNLK